MDSALSQLVDRQIRKALAEGQLTGLSGEGAPLPDRSGTLPGDFATEVATRITAEAGVVPEEFALRKLLDAARAAYGEVQGEVERRAAMAVIADLEMRYNTAREARRRFMR